VVWSSSSEKLDRGPAHTNAAARAFARMPLIVVDAVDAMRFAQAIRGNWAASRLLSKQSERLFNYKTLSHGEPQ
jgi:hypothetical protein